MLRSAIMRRLLSIALATLSVALPASAQGPKAEKGDKGKPAAGPDPRYENPELGISFNGVYGWEVKRAAGSGAWTELVRYSDTALDAVVTLLVRTNSYGNLEEMRRALQEEFKDRGGEPAVGKPVYKEIAQTDVEMRGGLKLQGIEVEAVELALTEEGKKRETQLVVRSYFGANRLFRILCEVRRSRAKKVRDLLDRALVSLAVVAKDEQTARGTPFQSVRGNWSALVPDGFSAVLGPSSWNSDMMFEEAKSKLSILVYAYAFPGSARDHLEELQDHYRDGTFKVTQEEAKVFSGDGFHAQLAKSDRLTIISAAVLGGQVYRVHTNAPPDRAADAQRVHDKFLATFRAGK